MEKNRATISRGITVMDLAPIALFVYNRPDHTRRVVEALQNNELAGDSDLFIFSDGPKTPDVSPAVNEVRNYIRSITGFNSVTLLERDINLGCAQSIVRGVSEIVEKFQRIIVVEDDILTSPFFLKFMNEGLNRYRDCEKVACIHGYVYPVDRELPETFFIRGTDNWGWATWKRGWDLYEPDCEKLLNELYARNLARAFNFDDSYDYTEILKDQIKGKLDAWDIRWYAAAFLRNKLTLYPGRALVRNIGLDGSGTHCGSTDTFDSSLTESPLRVKRIPIKENVRCRRAFSRYFKPVEEKFLERVTEKLRALFHIY